MTDRRPTPLVHDVEAHDKAHLHNQRWIERDTSDLLLILAGCAAFWFACGMLFMSWMGW